MDIDGDLEALDHAALVAEVKRLRAGIRAHRDASGMDLCWYHPALWGLLPEPAGADIAVPEWPQFLRGCVRYRQSLDERAPAAPRTVEEYDRRDAPDPAS
jgi:hypothetical protein